MLIKIKKLENAKDEILNFLQCQGPTDLNKSIGESWSMIQAVRHIQFVEESIIAYMKKKIQAGDNLPYRSLKGRLMLFVLFIVFFLRIKFKAPASVANPKISSLEELEVDWKNSRENMKEFLDDFPAKWETKAVYKHPAGMRINLSDTLRFLNVHLRHHIHQVHRIKKSLGS